MLKFIGIHLSGGDVLSVAVGAQGEYVEQTFACSREEVDQLFEFVLEAVRTEEPGIQFVIGPIERQAEYAALFEALAENGIANAVVEQSELEALAATGKSVPSGQLVVECFRQRFARYLKRDRTRT